MNGNELRSVISLLIEIEAVVIFYLSEEEVDERHSKEVAFALPTHPSRVRI